MNATICAPVNDGLRKSEKSNIGACCRSSTAAKSERAGRPRRRRGRSSGRCPSPSSSPRSSASTSEKRPPVRKTNPSASKPPCSSSRDSCRYADRAERRSATPIGRLTKKIQRQPAHSVSAPPTSGPIATAAPTVAPQIPKAVPRSRAVELLREDRERDREHDRPADALEAAGEVEEEGRGGRRRRGPRRA